MPFNHCKSIEHDYDLLTLMSQTVMLEKILTSAFWKLLMCHVGEVGPLEVASQTTEVRVDGKGGELTLIVAQHRTVYH